MSAGQRLGRTVSQVARITNVSVRALHHYDQIGLLRPSGRSDAGYRLYSEADLGRLQQILFFRALEVPLDEIARIMSDPDFDVLTTLRSQRELLIERVARAHALLGAIDDAIDDTLKRNATSAGKGAAMSDSDSDRTDEMFSAFHDLPLEDYGAEAEQRWGHTAAFKESKRRTARYTQADWDLIKREGEATLRRLADEQRAGTPPDSAAAMDAAEAHRLHIDRWFYPCSRALHRGLGELYVNDPRFTATLDRIGPGLAAYACAAFVANAARAR